MSGPNNGVQPAAPSATADARQYHSCCVAYVFQQSQNTTPVARPSGGWSPTKRQQSGTPFPAPSRVRRNLVARGG